MAHIARSAHFRGYGQTDRQSDTFFAKRLPYPLRACAHGVTRDLKITHPVRLRRFRLKFNGIGRRGFNQQKKVAKIRLRLVGVASFYWPRQIMIVQRRAYQLQKRSASYGGDYKLVIVPVHS